ncbi:MAG: 16S rRNA (cytidine(1402)-2'-O)-methyltransferase, partial [Pseudomonadota bacterium]|nr:16S rRNA (cytidine(1402)-2'-O)-methyltransferase [Pseudomonadota bacterium]
HHGISTAMVALHEHNEQAQSKVLVRKLLSGQSIALISDAGTPAVSDPGSRLTRMAQEAEVKVVPIPGPSALITAFCVSGFESSRFLFYGFLPVTASARRRVLEEFKEFVYPLIFYEAPHRIQDCIADLGEVLGNRKIVIARELTKFHENIVVLTLDEARHWLDADVNHKKGEFVLIVEGAPVRHDIDIKMERIMSVLLETLSVREAVSIALKLTGARKKDLYALALRFHQKNDPV